MKRWAILTVLLYALALLLLTVPVLLVAFGGWAKSSVMGLQDALKFYLNWGYWIWLGVLMAGQMLLLLLPINIAQKRLSARRPLQTPILVTAFFLANLCFAGILAILCAAFKEDGIYPFAILSGNTVNPTGGDFVVGGIITLLVFWLVWALIFRRYAKSDEPDALLKRSTRWLLRGSILDLLVAVPSHVIVRRREDCCAPIGTILGNRHGHLGDAAVLRAGCVFPVRGAVRAVEAEIAGREQTGVNGNRRALGMPRRDASGNFRVMSAFYAPAAGVAGTLAPGCRMSCAS